MIMSSDAGSSGSSGKSGIKDEIIGGLRRLDIRPDDTLLVHSSLRSLSSARTDAVFVLEALLDFLAEHGTVLMPALSYMTVTKDSPEFSLNGTPSCVGALTEAFRVSGGTVRSLHPTHSVCASGRNARQITENHFKDTSPVGRNSPFSLLPEYNGKILFIGCGITPNTSMHGVEEVVSAPYLMNPDKTRFVLKDGDGRTFEVYHSTHDFKGFEQRYDRIADYLEACDHKTGRIMEANCHVIKARPLWTKGVEALKADPYVFVDRIH
ncbi:MAG: AAC(3) family N-acetyltransferase [Saccharofermentanales bacterium]